MNMKRRSSNRVRTCAALLGAFILTASAQGQTIGQDDEGTPEEEPGRRHIEGLDAPSPQDEMTEIFLRVERRLREIDDLLSDASAGDVSALEGVEEAGIGDLLRTSRDGSQKVVEDIDRILEIASQNGGT
jgi:hypothetical protein